MSYFRTLMNLNELQVNGQVVDDNDDFNLGEENKEDGAEDTATSAPADTAEDAAEEENDNQQATTQNEEVEENGFADDEDDFTLDEDENLDDTEDNTKEANNNQAENQGEENTDEDATPATDNEIDDDFTMDGGEADDTEADNGEGSEDGDQQQQPESKSEKELPDDPTDAIDDDEKRASEEAIYDSLTDDQKRIRILQLKIDYKDLYETIINTLEGINDIPKNMDNLDTIKRLTTFLTKAKSILIDYVENNFDSNTYLENYTMYIKYLAIFRTTAKVMEELNVAAGKKPEDY